MPLKSTQTNKYERACFVQEAPTPPSEIDPSGYKVKKSIDGHIYVVFPATLWTFNNYNRMERMYDINNCKSVINNDERIQTLKAQNKWRGEWNHPNPDIKGQVYSDIRMTIPEPMRTSHFINNDKFIGNAYKATITTHPETECGRAVASEIVDLGAVPSFSVRLLGIAIPNAPRNTPNMRVTKVITFDLVDYPSHHDANADIVARIQQESANVIFLKELAKYCVEKDETLNVVCESFEISPNEIMGINNGDIVVEHAQSRMIFPLQEDIRREAISILSSLT